MESNDSDENSSVNSSEKWTEIKKKLKNSSTKINKHSDLNEKQSEENKQLSTSKIDKTTFIPSIYLHDASYYQEVLKDIKKRVINKFSTKLIGNSVKIMLTDQNDYEIITKFYKKHNLSFHTCRCPSDQKLAVAIKGIPHSLTIEELTKVLQKKFPLIRIQRVINKSNKPTSTCFVELVNNSDGREILNLEYVYYTKVTVEIWRMNSNSQCNNCQKYIMKKKPKKSFKPNIKQPESCNLNEAENTIENTKCNFCESFHKDFMLCPYYEKLFLKMDHKTIDFHSNKNEIKPEQKKHEAREPDDKIAEILKEYIIDSNVKQQSLMNDHKIGRKEIYEVENLKKIFNESMVANQTNDKQKDPYPRMVWLDYLWCGLFVIGICYLLLNKN